MFNGKISFLIQQQLSANQLRAQTIVPVMMTLEGDINGLAKGEALICEIRTDKTRNAEGEEVEAGRHFECNDHRVLRLVRLEFTAQ